jgi:hypothetical protein
VMDCPRERKLKPSFLQKLLNQGFDISFQQFSRFAGDECGRCVLCRRAPQEANSKRAVPYVLM